MNEPANFQAHAHECMYVHELPPALHADFEDLRTNFAKRPRGKNFVLAEILETRYV